MSDRDEFFRALPLRLAQQPRHSVLRDHVVGELARDAGGAGRREFPDDGRNVFTVGRQLPREDRVDGAPSVRQQRANHELDLPADAAEVARPDAFAANLSPEGDFERALMATRLSFWQM